MPGLLPERNVKTILFDFDGTLADTTLAGVVAFNKIAERYGFAEITHANEGALRSEGPRAAMKTLGVPFYRIPTVLRTLRSGVRDKLPSLSFMTGMGPALFELKQRGYQLGIVSSASEENVRMFLENNHANLFSFIQAGVGIFNKAAKIRKVLSRENLDRSETIFVGDEIRDIEAAHKNGLPTIAVTWGLNSRDALAAAGADFLADTASQLLEIIEHAHAGVAIH